MWSESIWNPASRKYNAAFIFVLTAAVFISRRKWTSLATLFIVSVVTLLVTQNSLVASLLLAVAASLAVWEF
jgi:hypothetical protein